MEDLHYWETKFEPCCYSERLLGKISLLNKQVPHYTKVNLLEIKKAIYYAKKYHGSQKRESGEPYYYHPLEVAYLVSNHLFETNAIVTSVLHDTVEDTVLTKDMIGIIFNQIVAEQVEDLTRVKLNQKISSSDIVTLLIQHKKYEALIIKEFDRLHNMQTIKAKSPEKQQKIILETLETFLPLAAYLRMPMLEEELSALCIHTNLSRQGLRLLRNRPKFSFQGSYQPPSLDFQNATIQQYIQKVLGS